ncbi:ComEC/Rec2 family competence protein [Microbacterium sp. cf332]|uniref:ComEC/Rec2 family competence protein n=1 Tax=Microbacterium sp. cf332 TaxID=1761804 RepID=UPI0008811DB7|nr:ComEC/Rec2 family competence protein [Microbacterium sp. cf332]SDQ08868.1 competence protein ComEC [Microbacterium sp. cf332]
MPVAAVVWAAALAAICLPETALLGALLLWGAAATGLMVSCRLRASSRAESAGGSRGTRRSRGARGAGSATAVVALAFAAAAVSHVAIASPERERVADLPITGGRSVVVEADVTGKIEGSATGWRFDALATRIRVGADEVETRVPVVIRTAERSAGLDLGASVSMQGTAFVADAADRAVIVVNAARPPDVLDEASGPFAVASALRAALLDQAASLPQPGAGLIAGLAVGDTSAVTTGLDEQMKTASLSHLTAVSGANCALVVGIAFAGAALLGLPRGWRVAAAVTTLAGFVVLVSPEPSVVRAAAMAAIAMLAALLGRAGAGVAVLTNAVILCLIADPWLAASMGFALSAAATGALLVLAGPVTESLARFVPRPLALAIAVPVAAQLACTPLLVMIDPRLPVYAVIANAVTAPAAPLATVAGLLACLSAPVPVLASGFAAIAWLPCAWIAAAAEVFAAAPGASVPWLSDAPGVLLAAALCAAVVAVLLPGVPRVVRRTGIMIVALAFGAAAGIAIVAGPLEQARTPGDWAVALCDVGQGDAVLIRSAGRIALIDVGPDPQALGACLARFDIARVDLLVLTHFDLDHIGGADAVADRVALVLHGPVGGASDEALLTRLSERGADVLPAVAGMSGTLGEASWSVLWPSATVHGFPPGNDASVVLEVSGRGMPSTLLLGDLSETAQRVAGGRVAGGYDVVKVAHHGSADQSPALYRRVMPRIALIGVGENDYGHPRAETLTLLGALGAEIVRTDMTGSATISMTSEGIRVWRERSEPP